MELLAPFFFDALHGARRAERIEGNDGVTVKTGLKLLAIEGLHHSRPLVGAKVDRLAGTLFNKRRKRYISPDTTPAEFFRILAERQVEYVVLRWFENLPEVDPGHDIDLLVADADLPKLDDLVGYWPLGQQIDIYSETGGPGFGYAPWYVEPKAPHTMSVFPPHLSRRLLEDATLKDGLIRVPGGREHLFALAYHAIYLKGPCSGLVSRNDPGPARQGASHDYAAVLSDLAAKAGIPLPARLTFEDLDDMLGEHGWRPPHDTLERISVWAPWVRTRHFGRDGEDKGPDGLAVFLIRQKAVDEGLKDKIVHMIEARGFEVLATKEIAGAKRDFLTTATRGGNWGEGAYGASGGPPACAVAVLDVLPTPVTAEFAKLHPLLENERIAHAKNIIRDIVNRGRKPEETYNALHSTDSHSQGWRMVRALFPDDLERIGAIVAQRQAQFAAHETGLVDLTSYGNRARVEVIRWGDGLAVRKVFKPHCTRFLDAEVKAHRAMAHSRHTPRLLEVGKDYFVMEHFDDVWRGKPPKRLSLSVVRQLSAFIKDCAATGYDPIDLKAGNLIMDRKTGLKVIDYEFWHDRGGPYPPMDAYALRGIPTRFKGEYPVGSEHIFNPYPLEWYSVVGMDRQSFLAAGSWRDPLLRAWNFPIITLRKRLGPRLSRVLRITGVRHLVSSIPRRMLGLDDRTRRKQVQ